VDPVGSSVAVAVVFAPPKSAWEFHQLLCDALHSRGVACGGLVALRVMTEGWESGLVVVQQAFLNAFDEASEAWRVRHNCKPPVAIRRR